MDRPFPAPGRLQEDRCTTRHTAEQNMKHPLTATRALTRQVSLKFENCLTTANFDTPINIKLAKKQHDHYIKTLESLLENVTEIPSSDVNADCCFIEDTSFVLNDTWIINRLGHETRRDEVIGIQPFIPTRFKQLVMQAPATLDGGDVLNTGKHVIIGKSHRTNAEGIKFIQSTFPSTPVFTVDMPDVLHLKCLVTSLDNDTLILNDEPFCRDMITREPFKQYKHLFVPDRIFANLLSFPACKTVVVQKGFPRSEAFLDAWAVDCGWKVIKLDMSEFIKADGALTCCSILY